MCTNLPEDAATLLKERAKAKPDSPLQAEIHLGYFDDFARFRRVSPVMVGAINSVQNKPNKTRSLRWMSAKCKLTRRQNI